MNGVYPYLAAGLAVVLVGRLRRLLLEPEDLGLSTTALSVDL